MSAPRWRAPKGVDWALLRAAAHTATTRSYAPYSRLCVGAAALTDTGEVIAGCNVENASYGLTLCAECGLVSALRTSGATRLVAVSITDHLGRFLAPCGRCRQLLLEHGGPDLAVDGEKGPRPLSRLLPDHFGAEHLPE